MYPSNGLTFISNLRARQLTPGFTVSNIQQKPRVLPESSGVQQSSFNGTVPILNLPSVTQGVKRLPFVTLGSNATVYFIGK